MKKKKEKVQTFRWDWPCWSPGNDIWGEQLNLRRGVEALPLITRNPYLSIRAFAVIDVIFWTARFWPLSSEGEQLDGVKDLNLKAKAIIWPWLSYMCHILWRADPIFFSKEHIETGIGSSSLICIAWSRCSSNTKVCSVVYDSGLVPDKSIFSPRETSPWIKKALWLNKPESINLVRCMLT